MDLERTQSSPAKQALIVSAISSIVLLVLLLTQFGFKYGSDIFEKHLDVSVIFKLFVFSSITFISIIFTFCMLIFGAVYCRLISRMELYEFKKRLRKSILPVMIISLACCILSAFLIPAVQIRQFALLYDIRMKSADEPLIRTDIGIFEDYPLTSNYFQLNYLAALSEKKIMVIKEQAIALITAAGSREEVYKMMDNNLAIELGFSIHDFEKAGLKKADPGVNAADINIDNLLEYLASIKVEMDREGTVIRKIDSIRAKMIGFPFFVFISFFLGTAIGILNRDNKSLILLLVGIYFAVFPATFYLSMWFDKLVMQQKIGPFMGQLYFLLILTMVTFFLWLNGMKMIQTNKVQVIS